MAPKKRRPGTPRRPSRRRVVCGCAGTPLSHADTHVGTGWADIRKGHAMCAGRGAGRMATMQRPRLAARRGAIGAPGCAAVVRRTRSGRWRPPSRP
ncbi:hypothetical protein CYD94_16540 [Ralstonia solanacearum]|uniref:Uncharacterized protein n=2 Tax=Ralstonia solanacearum species complex TaxID=3116862 RepID=A0A454TWC8_9RALS|nr:hypothetical protein CIG66_14935 [Ralstonia pseudosolanacearum]AUS43609.1 hypothetical protein CYD94_16540 [Ralstonia solanacearum]AXV74318.1 hypothetical protein CJO75_15090 [Ralstonia solanacearum]AXW15970.1 hypothetical protein CJO84_15290 [Ralstonia solanacearum]AXW39559.1 hypothetical protein CJO89_15660 [Ralstonia solanacearum]